MALIRMMNSALGALSAQAQKLTVVGNNIANVNTVGFKNSRVYFSSAFLQTLRMGSAPNGSLGGINPMQVGLGVQVGSILRQHTQGEIELTGVNSDLAIEGDGYFKVETENGIRFSRGGVFRLNLTNQLVDPNGALLHGYMADANFNVTPTDDSTTEITINIGGQTIVVPTTELAFDGNLDPTGDIGRSTGGQRTQSARLYNTATGNDATADDDLTDVSTTSGTGGPAFISAGDTILVEVQKGGRQISVPENTVLERFTEGVDGTTVGDFVEWIEDKFGIRTGTDMYSDQVTNGTMTGATTTTITDTNADFLNDGVRVGDTIYISSGDNVGEVREITAVTATTITWSTAMDSASAAGDTYEVYKPAGASVDVLLAGAATGGTTTTLVDAGATFVTDGISVGDVIYFNSGAESGNTAVVTAVTSETTLTFAAMTTGPSAGDLYSIRNPSVDQGTIVLRANIGVTNAFSNITTQLESDGTSLLTYTEEAAATGSSTRTAYVVYDSLGNSHLVNVTWVLARQTDSTSIWEAFYESDDNNSAVNTSDGDGNRGIRIGFDRLTFDEDGDFVSSETSSNQATITLEGMGVDTPLIFTAGYDRLTSKADGGTSSVNLFSQDGKPLGQLEGFSIGEDGTVTGIFSNGVTRTLAQVAVTRFMNENGLIDDGHGLFKVASNSGPAQTGVAMTGGRGRVIGGALEASNVDLAKEFTDLIVAQRAFQASARTITTADELLQELVNLRR